MNEWISKEGKLIQKWMVEWMPVYRLVHPVGDQRIKELMNELVKRVNRLMNG